VVGWRSPVPREQRNAQGGGDRRGAGDGDETAGLPLEQQELDREEDSRHGRGEDRRHPGRRAGDEQRLALDRRQMERLGEHRAERPARRK